MSYWRTLAEQEIARVHAQLPPDATLKQRTAAIDAARPLWLGASWPDKKWREARRAYLSKYGYKPPQSRKPTALDLLPRDPLTGRPLIR